MAEEPRGSRLHSIQTVVLFSAIVLRSCAGRIRSVPRAHVSDTVEHRGRGGWSAGRFWCFIRNRSQMGAGQAEVNVSGTGYLPKQVSSISELSQHQTPCRGSCHRPGPQRIVLEVKPLLTSVLPPQRTKQKGFHGGADTCPQAPEAAPPLGAIGKNLSCGFL